MTVTAHAWHSIPATDSTAIFIGDVAGMVAEITETWTSGGADEGWADVVLAGLGPDEQALATLSFIGVGPAVAHRLAATRSVPEPGSAASAVGILPPPGGSRRHQITAVIGEDRYVDMVREAVERIEAGPLHKVVLGRVVDIVSDPPLRAGEVLQRMLVERPGRYVFSIPLRAGADSPVLLGASPELLIRRRGLDITSVPLAGSIPRSEDPQTDRERADALLASAKEQAEHAFVVDGITELLAPHCAQYTAPARPTVLATDTMWHLASPIRGRLRAGADTPSALHLARMLQPTAAVGGTPTDLAEQTITELEGELRGFLAGAVGWVDGAGDGEFALAIRSGVLHGDTLRLFAGAGIVHGSDPAAELREVGAKLQTMIRAVGL